MLSSCLSTARGQALRSLFESRPRPGATAARSAYGWAVQSLLDRSRANQVMTLALAEAGTEQVMTSVLNLLYCGY